MLKKSLPFLVSNTGGNKPPTFSQLGQKQRRKANLQTGKKRRSRNKVQQLVHKYGYIKGAKKLLRTHPHYTWQ